MASCKLWFIFIIATLSSFDKVQGQQSWDYLRTCSEPRDVHMNDTRLTAYLTLREKTWGENCMFYKLLLKNVAEVKRELGTGSEEVSIHAGTEFTHHIVLMQVKNLLKSDPPGANTNSDTTVSIHNIETDYFFQSEWKQQFFMDLIIKASWTDKRLAWDTESIARLTPEQRLWFPVTQERARIHPKDVWHPDFANGFLTQMGSEKFSEHQAFVHKNGTVEMTLVSRLQSQSQMNYDGFPNDKHDACVQLRCYTYYDVVKYVLNTNVVGKRNISRHGFPAWWKITGSSVGQDEDEGQINICLKLQRYSTIYTYKIVLPLAACTFLAVVIPIFSGWKLQIAAKLLALVLTFLSITFTSRWGAVFGADVPRFIKVYDFLIWSTVTSVSFTVVLWGLSMQKFFKPAPHMLVLITNLINPLFCWTNPTGDNYVSFGGIGGDSEKGDENPVKNVKDYSKEWSSIFLGINNILLLIYSAIYIIGLIVCSV